MGREDEMNETTKRVMRVVCCAAVGLALGVATGCESKKDEAPAPATGAPATAAPAAPPQASGPPIVQAELEARSKRILEAYKAKDLNTLASLGPKKAKDVLIFLEPRNPNYQTLLGDDTWRMRSLRAWDGEITKIRVGVGVVQVHYHDLDGGMVAALELIPEDGKWVFHDLVRLDQEGKPVDAPVPPATPPAEVLPGMAPSAPAPAEPAPTEPAPTDAPSEPAPAEPTPGDAPAEPAPPAEPTPGEPTTEPAPSE